MALLEMHNISKRFGGTVALDRVDFTAEAGEVHALLGQNGAGKSTLMKILAGALAPDGGSIRLDGREVRPRSVAEARSVGIVQIFQELTILPELSVARNIFLGREETAAGGLLRGRRMNQLAESHLARVGLSLDVRRRAGDFSVAQQQMIEIARALSCDARVLIMDEPTSCLTSVEVAHLFEAIRRVAAAGTLVIYISHRLGEILRIADRVTVMRDGRIVEIEPVTASTSAGGLVRHMIGRSWNEEFPQRTAAVEAELLTVRGLGRRGAFGPTDLEVRRGEVVGLFGLVGAGRTELARAIFGADAADQGEVFVAGRAIPGGDCRAAIAAGIALVPEDRKSQGVLLGMSVQRNVTIAILGRLCRGGLLRSAAVRETAARYARRMRLVAPSLSAEVYALSGGNQQKVALAKWLARDASVLIVDEPTRGIDVEAKREIYGLVNELVSAGRGVLLISSETEEVRGMSDRILVMYRGRIVASLTPAEATDEMLLAYATGGLEAAA